MLLAQVRWEVWLIPVTGLLAVGLIALLGMRFLHKVQDKQGRAQPLKPSRRERRVHLRSRPQVREVLVRTTDEKAEPGTATILDRSSGGVGIELREKMNIGQRLQLRLEDWAAEAAWVNVEVRYCRPQGDGWRVGCRFLDVSTWEALNLFGPPDRDEP